MISSDIYNHEAVSPKSISIFAIETGESLPTVVHAGKTPGPTTIWAIAFPEELAKLGAQFWRLTGTGISSRLAEHCLRDVESMQRVDRPVKRFYSAMITVHPVYQTICARIAHLMERAPTGTPRSLAVKSSDVFLYPSGMSAIYHVQQMLLQWRGLETVVIGYPHELTIKMMETYGPSSKFYYLGTDEQIDEFEMYLDAKVQAGSMIQAVWCECPSNSLLYTVDLERIRKLADTYGFVLVVDETIGSFANVDVLGVADIVVTSLSKSYYGYADLLAGRYETPVLCHSCRDSI
jgi:cystathionine gamma-synthase